MINLFGRSRVQVRTEEKLSADTIQLIIEREELERKDLQTKRN